MVAKDLERAVVAAGAPAAAADDVRLMREEVERCRRILARMRIDAGDPAGERFARVSVRELVDDCLDDCSTELERAVSVTLDETTAAAITALPRHAFGQALRGLVDNARQASPPGAPVTLRVAADDSSRRLVFEIADCGPGILARSPRPGRRAVLHHQTGRTGDGAGDLPGARHRRTAGWGALHPLGARRRHDRDALAAGRGGAVKTAGGAILLVDDDEVFRERLARALRERGYDVATAADHDGAVAAARERKPDFAIVNLRMPGLSGLALIGPLHAISPGARIVVLTGYGSITSAVEALRAGAHDYLSKPVDADQIIGALTGEAARPAEATAPSPTLARAEWEHIQRILADTHNNISETARRLGITRRTLQLKLKKYPPQF